jgi:hypothetical protein
MTRRVEWAADAEIALFALPVRDADRILDAIDALAERNRGFVRAMLDDHGTLGLYVRDYVVLFVHDETTIEIRGLRRR